MEQKNTESHKRQDRSVSPETRRKISSTLKSYNSSHPRDDSYRKSISSGLKAYWQNIPKPKKKEEDTTIEDIMM